MTELEKMKSWIGRTEAWEDRITPVPLKALAATLDSDDAPSRDGDAVPPCWHWLYFLPLQAASGIGADGHPRRGGFLPPVPLPRRMWAGSRLEFHQPLRCGDAVRRDSRIEDVAVKSGRTGMLVFVRVRHAISGPQGLAITEEQDIVYREMAKPGAGAPAAKPAPIDPQFSRVIVPDPVLLFRYSALTFNGHRIHYDRPYATGEEGYAGLVVHGPLIATLLLEQVRRSHPALRVRTFEFKAVSPLIDTNAFEVCGRIDGGVAELWAQGPGGTLAMQARAEVETA